MALRIKELREARGWTQDDLAAKANISRSQLAQIESEARPANTLRLNSIAAAMQTTVSSLFSRNEVEDRLLDVVGALSAEDQRALVRMAEALALQGDTGA